MFELIREKNLTKVSYSNGDLIFISKNPIDDDTQKEHILGIVEKFLNSELMIVRVVLLQTDPRSLAIGKFLNKHSQWHVTKICNLATINREYQALMSIDTLKLSEELMHPGNINYIDFDGNKDMNNKSKIDNIINISLNKSNPTTVDNFYIPKKLENKLNYFYNTSQLEALKTSIKKKGLTLIQGPPGTGKSTTILGILSVILNALAKKEGSNRKDSVFQSVNSEINLKNNINMEIDDLNKINDLNVDQTGKKESNNYNFYGNPKQQPWVFDNNYKNWMDDAIIQDDYFYEFPQSKKTDCFKILQKPVEDDISPPEKILVCAPSNVAIDEIVRKMMSSGLKDSEGNNYMVKFVRIGPNYHPSVREYALDFQMTEKINSKEAKEMDSVKNEILLNVKVVFSTLSMSGSTILTSINQKFDTVIIDEAAQAVELSTLIPLKYGCERLILVGDPKQLAATVFSSTAIKHNYDLSLFKRFQEAGHQVVILKTQYRMHKKISKFISETFYDGLLEDYSKIADSTENEVCLSLPAFQPMTFYDIESDESFENNSFSNEDQIAIIIKLIEKLRNIYTPSEIIEKVSIISPYSSQVYKLKEIIKRMDCFNDNIGYIDVNTVDGFQGKEKSIIIFSTVRSKGSNSIGFLGDERRMNVGLSRAKSSLVIIGDSKKLTTDKNWEKLVKYSFREGTFYKVKGDIEEYFDNFEENSKQYLISTDDKFIRYVFNPTKMKIEETN
jgi:senataxin